MLKKLASSIVLFILARTPRCDEMSLLASESLDHPLPPRIRLKMKLHHLFCKWCKRYKKQLHFIRETLGDAPEKLGEASKQLLPPAGKDRIREAIRKSSS